MASKLHNEGDSFGHKWTVIFSFASAKSNIQKILIHFMQFNEQMDP